MAASPRYATGFLLLLCYLLSSTSLAAARGVVDAELKTSPAGGYNKKPVVKPPPVYPAPGANKPGPVYPAPGARKPGPVHPPPGATKPAPGAGAGGGIPMIPGFNIPGMGGIGNGIPGLGGGWGGGSGGPAGGYSRGGVVVPSVVCSQKGPCYGRRVTCPRKCFASYSGAGKGYGGGGGGGSCTFDCKVKCTAYC